MAARARKAAPIGLPPRKLVTSHYDVQVADDDEIEAVAAEMVRAERAVTMAMLSKDKAVKDAAAEAMAAAEARRAACHQRVTFSEMRPSALDELVSKFPHPDEEEFELLPSDWQWPMIHHLAAASAPQVGWTADQWAEWTDGWSRPTWIEFRDKVRAAQRKDSTGTIPKG